MMHRHVFYSSPERTNQALVRTFHILNVVGGRRKNAVSY